MIGGFSLGNAAPYLRYIRAAQLAGAKVFGVIDRTPGIQMEEPGTIQISDIIDLNPNEQLKGKGSASFSLTLDHVSFHYPSRPDVPILHKVNAKP